ncbi:hypothetical protein B5G36_03140 [Ligilactobacillus salivarius]|uniref:Uncharacterized protein n=1 Tax=Ligilactobacillus salivarius TaxID=1624 RepID=A0A1Y3S485_9LACO|nr:hypothetical protein [Ligilactobacillus salivarius]OUN18993.1 hypothetical protein B5G36_03140 [Ligilactobacillus salivarius]HJG15459.1 hypothetical protein [Ligilactobacillus salivarius]
MFKGNVLKQIKDSDFLKITWDSKDKKLIKNAVKDLNTTLNEQTNSRTVTKISSNFPEYLTFSQAERLFREIIRKTEDNQEIVKITKVEVMHQEEGQKPSSEQEATAENIVLDSNFKMILVPLIEAVFTNQDEKFAAASYEDKYRYFAESLYQSYAESTGVSVDYLPILPSEEDVDLALNTNQELRLNFNYDTSNIEEAENTTDEVGNDETVVDSEIDDSVAAKVSAMDAFNNESSEEYDSLNDFSDSNQDNYLNNDYQLSQENDEYSDYNDYQNSTQESNFNQNQRLVKFPDDTGMVLQGNQAQVIKPQETTINSLSQIDLTGQKVITDFPLFEVKDFPKSSYAPYEKEYVDWKLNEAKKEFNSQLLRRSEVTKEYSLESIRQELKEFESVEIAKINEEIKALDNRASLKDLITNETHQAELEERQHADQQLEKEEKSAIDDEERRHEKKLNEIKSDFERKRHESKFKTRQKYLQEAQRRLQEEYLETTTYLERLLKDKLIDLEKAKLARQEDLIAETKEASRQIGQSLYDQKKAKIEKLIKVLRKEHDTARREYLIKKAEDLAQQEREDTIKTNAQLRGRINELEKQKNEVQNNRIDMENKLLEEKRKAINDHADLYVKLQNSQTNQAKHEEKVETSKETKESFNWGKVALYSLIASLLFVTIGGVFYYQHRQNQIQANRVQALIESQKQTKSELQAQKSSVEAEKQKAQSDSKKKSESQSKQKIEDLEKQLSSLKAQSSSTQESSAQSSESK